MTDKKILAVDDVSLNLRTIKAALEKYFEVRIAKSGELALRIIESEKIDLILLDIEMPEMSGFDFMKSLNMKVEQGTLAAVPPVIFVTAHATQELLAKAKMAGGIGYVMKPFDPKVLYERVALALGFVVS